MTKISDSEKGYHGCVMNHRESDRSYSESDLPSLSSPIMNLNYLSYIDYIHKEYLPPLDLYIWLICISISSNKKSDI